MSCFSFTMKCDASIWTGIAVNSSSIVEANVVGVFYKNGWYKCLDLPGGNTANGNKLQIWDCNGKNNQKWVFAPGSYKVTYAANSGKCVDVPGGDFSNGNQLQIWDCNGQKGQVWGYDSNMGTIYLAQSNGDASKCMDLRGGSTNNGNGIELWDCNGKQNQQWVFSPPSPGPSPSPSGTLYCPSQNDFEGSSVNWNSGGWTMTGGGGVHGKQTFNLLGGYIEFEIDTTHAQGGVNNNFYLVSPDPSYFRPTNDCDIQGKGKPSCMEMDIIENNGNCLGQTTWHTWANNKGGCDRGGCWGQKKRSGVTKIRAEFTPDGWMTVYMDGTKIDVVHPTPSAASHKYVHDTMASRGVQIQSSQWVGWVPGASQCPGGGNLGGSTFSIRNVRVSGTVVQGPPPSKCNGQMVV